MTTAGWSRGQIQKRLDDGYLIQLHRGVYAVGHRPPTVRSRWSAAVLFAGPGSVLSYRSAAALWGFGPENRPIDVTREGRRGGSISGLAVHHTTHLPQAHRTETHGIPVTTPARTLVDLAALEPPSLLDDRLSAARRLNLLDCSAVRTTLREGPVKKGAGELAGRLRLFEESEGTTRSELETRFLRLCSDAGLPLPEVDVAIGSTFADFLWREQRLIVEVDGFKFHHHRFDEDRERDLGRLVNGYRTARITYLMIKKRPRRVVESLRWLIESAPGPGPSRNRKGSGGAVRG